MLESNGAGMQKRIGEELGEMKRTVHRDNVNENEKALVKRNKNAGRIEIQG